MKINFPGQVNHGRTIFFNYYYIPNQLIYI